MNPTPTDGDDRVVRVYTSDGPEDIEKAPATAPVPHAPPAPASRQLPPGGNKLNRISQHTRGLVQDMSSWVELKLKLTQIEIEERIDAKVNQIATNAIAGVVAALGGLFMLIALALGIAAILIALEVSPPLSYFLGFLGVALLLLLTAALVRKSRPNLVSVGDKKAHVDDSRVTPTVPASRPARNSA